MLPRRRDRRVPVPANAATIAAMKSGWAFGAAFVAVVLVLLLFGSLAIQMGSAERLSSTEAADGIEVPTVGTVGDFPDPAHRHVVNVMADGGIVVGGQTLSFRDLSVRLRTWSELSDVWYSEADVPVALPTSGKVYRHSAEDILLRLDARLPWAAAELLIDEAFKAAFIRIWIVVGQGTDGGEGALGYPTTIDGVSLSFAQSRACIPSRQGYGVDVVVGEGDGTPAALYRELQALPPPNWLGRGGFDVTLCVDGRQPVGSVLQLWDAVLRAKASALGVITKGRRSSDSYNALVGTPAVVLPYSLWLSYAPPALAIDPGPMAPVARTRGLAMTFRPWMPSDVDDADRRRIPPSK
jgi:hypothetical protein